MVTMENTEEILQILERFTRHKPKDIPKELEDYLQYVAKTGDTIFKWSSLKYLFREKLLHVIKHFNEDPPRLEEIPNYPNVDPFNYETMKSSLLERLDLFNAAPFTVQRLCELLIDPRKQYSRIDKFMRALEKNILVVSTIDPGRKRTESENGDSLDSVVNGDLSLEVNIDIEMENESLFNNVDERNGNGDENVSGTLKASCPRSDDTVQPKAKKAKLDFESDEQRGDEEAGVNTDDVDETDEGAAETPIEIAAALKSKNNNEIDSNEGETDATDAAELADSKNEADAKQQTSETEEADAVTESKPVKQVLNGINVHRDECRDEETTSDREKKETIEKTAETDETTETSNEVDEENETTSESKKVKPQTDKIVEKQDVESVEKTAGTVVDEQAAKEPATSIVKVEESRKESVTARETVAEEKTIKTDDAKKTIEDEKTKEINTSLESAVPAEVNLTATLGTRKDEQEEAKTAAAGIEDAKKDAEAPAEGSVSTDQKTTQTDEIEHRKDDQVNANKDAVTAILKTADPVPIETDEPAIEAGAVTAASGVLEASADTAASTSVVSVAPPALALNDQPMEDTPVDEESTTVVDEVVMADSNGVSAADMATDELAKDEPAAMEVDDTSQEVMDQ